MPNTIRTKIAHLREGKLTKSQRKLLNYFESVDYKQVIYMSITDLAAATDVAEATVLRFCRSLGFNGYQEFRLSLAQGVIDMGYKEEEGIGYVAELTEMYTSALDSCRKTLKSTLLQQAQDMIRSARTISCFGVGHSHLAALELHNRLMTMGMLSYCEQDAHLQNIHVSSRTAEDLLILFSISGSSKDVVEAAELARSCGMKVLVITCYEKSPLTTYADLTLSSAPIEPNAMSGKIIQLFMVDVLTAGIRHSDKVRYDSYLAKSRLATAPKHF